MKRQLISIAILLFTLIIPIFAQDDDQEESKCNCSECHQFDFWIGNWKVEWVNQDSTISKGSNLVNSIFDGCVIEENFDGSPGMDFSGKSLTVYNHNLKLWQQTWVDSQGYYLPFTGGIEHEKMILSRTVETTSGPLTQRMVFYNIQKDSFDWNWESSTDGGENWQLNWQISYSRI